MTDCTTCKHARKDGLPNWSTMPCVPCQKIPGGIPTMYEAKSNVVEKEYRKEKK